MTRNRRSHRVAPALFAVLIAGGCATRHDAAPPSLAPDVPAFDTPDAALNALVDGAEDPERADALLGPGGAEVLCGGDAESSDDLAEVRAKMAEKIAFADDGSDRCRVVIGAEEWELPIELVRVEGKWRFDADGCAEERLRRTVGGNELRAIATLRELVEAQREYYAAGPDGGAHVYADRWCSAAGRRDGLFWEAADGAPSSPLGPGFCRTADEEGTTDTSAPDLSVPVAGYRYRILARHDTDAAEHAGNSSGAPGRFERGFAIVAWPTAYVGTGVMSFAVTDAGVVFEKDLGPGTDAAAAALADFDPDGTWTPVRD